MSVIIGLCLFGLWMLAFALLGKLCSTNKNKENMPEKGKTDKLYAYYCLKTPPSINTLPRNGLVYASDYCERRYVYEINRMAYGCAMYNRMLTPEEISLFGLICEPVDSECE